MPEPDKPQVPNHEFFEYVDKPLDLGQSIAEFDPTPYLRQIRGKGGASADYLDVRHRLLWLRSQHPDAEIVTDIVRIDDQSAVFKATVSLPGGGVATGHGSETVADFADYIEKAETKALGRALNALGFGAQFADSDGEQQRAARGPGRSGIVARTQSERPPAKHNRSVGNSAPLADFSWTAFWEWARSEGYATKDDLDRTVGRSTSGMSPAEIRELLRQRGG